MFELPSAPVDLWCLGREGALSAPR